MIKNLFWFLSIILFLSIVLGSCDKQPTSPQLSKIYPQEKWKQAIVPVPVPKSVAVVINGGINTFDVPANRRIGICFENFEFPIDKKVEIYFENEKVFVRIVPKTNPTPVPTVKAEIDPSTGMAAALAALDVTAAMGGNED